MKTSKKNRVRGTEKCFTSATRGVPGHFSALSPLPENVNVAEIRLSLNLHWYNSWVLQGVK